MWSTAILACWRCWQAWFQLCQLENIFLMCTDSRFRDAKPYRVERDPVISHNLHVSLQTTSQVKALTSAWAVNNVPGYRNIKMYTAGASNESVSHTRPQYRSQRGGHQGQFTSYNNYSSQNR
ncbi:hypothetical protein C8J57DRAFT_1214076 [Mycena rebaudengoi]|nr:hypothetical protein C8J57DRAFT_1214076 [Mycena rebaudengoi]